MFQVEWNGIATKHAQDVATLQRLIAEDSSRLGPRSGRQVSHMTSSLPNKKNVNHSFRSFKRVLAIDVASKTAWVEPGVTMEELCAQTLSYGLLPFVVPEFRAITVGGAIMGAALESSSFCFGQFNDACLEYELLLADGTRLEVSPKSHADLFYGITGSYGSLATLVSAKLKLRSAKECVRLEYRITESHPDRLLQTIRHAAEPAVDFLDALVLSEKRSIVMVGCLCSRAEVPDRVGLERFSASRDKWFCQHVLDQTDHLPIGDQLVDYLPVQEYLFRYDRGAFWMGQFLTSWAAAWRFFLEVGFGNENLTDHLHAAFQSDPPTLRPSLLFRLCAGKKLMSRQLYRILHLLPKGVFGKTFLVQDFCLPYSQFPSFLTAVQNQTGIYPLWLCPLRGTETPQFLSPHYLQGEKSQEPFDFINVGIYGIPTRRDAIEKITRELEELTYAAGGRKGLYAMSYQSADTFWKRYDVHRYEELRHRYGAVGKLMNLYERTHLGGKR